MLSFGNGLKVYSSPEINVNNQEEKRKILMVVTSAEFGGAQEHVVDLVSGLRSRYRIGLAAGRGDSLPRQLEKFGVEFFLVGSFRREISPLQDLKTVFALRKILKKWRPDLLHAHTSKAGVMVKLQRVFSRLPIVYTPHNWSFNHNNATGSHRLNYAVESLTNRFADKIVCVSQAELDLVEDAWFRDRVTVIPNGIEIRPLLRMSREKIILWVGRFEEPKLPELAISAFLGLPEKIRSGWRLVLLGEGSKKAELQRCYAENSNVIFLGYVPRSEVLDWMARSSGLVLVSRWESFGLAALEAMNLGLPVLASEVGGLCEILRDGETGFLVRNDLDSVAQGMLQLLQDPARRQRIGEQAYAASLEYSKERMVDAVDRVYTDLLRRRAT